MMMRNSEAISVVWRIVRLLLDGFAVERSFAIGACRSHRGTARAVLVARADCGSSTNGARRADHRVRAEERGINVDDLALCDPSTNAGGDRALEGAPEARLTHRWRIRVKDEWFGKRSVKSKPENQRIAKLTAASRISRRSWTSPNRKPASVGHSAASDRYRADHYRNKRGPPLHRATRHPFPYLVGLGRLASRDYPCRINPAASGRRIARLARLIQQDVQKGWRE
jgi:hypothetical protein